MRRGGPAPDAVLNDVLEALEGATWHLWDRPRRRLVIWQGAPFLVVVDLDDGAQIATWPIHPSPDDSTGGGVITRAAAEAAAAERIAQGHL